MKAIIFDVIIFIFLSALLASGSWLFIGRNIIWKDERGVSLEEAIKLGDGAIWVDARKGKDFLLGHRPGAINLNEHAWNDGMEKFLNVWSPGKEIIIYCDSGGCRSGHHVAAHLERDLGVKPRVVIGGWSVVKVGTRK